MEMADINFSYSILNTCFTVFCIEPVLLKKNLIIMVYFISSCNCLHTFLYFASVIIHITTVLLSGCMFPSMCFPSFSYAFSFALLKSQTILYCFRLFACKHPFNTFPQKSWVPEINTSLPASLLTVAFTKTVQKHPVDSDRYTWFSWPSTHRTWMFAGSVWSMVIAFPTDGFRGHVHLPVNELSLLKH